jgi:membrane associated rhomboid family serine protease
VIPLRDANPTRRVPIVTVSLIVACIAVFLVELQQSTESGGDAALEQFITMWGVVPSELVAALRAGAIVSMETITLITSQFLHGGLLHIGGNMLYLWIFGNNVEDHFGRLRFLIFYLVGGIVAAFTQVAVDPTSAVPTIGASGAIAAVLGAYLILFPRARVTTAIFVVFFYQLINVPAVIVLVFWFLIQVFSGVGSLGADTSTTGGVATFAHIGGFVFGAAVALIVKNLGGSRRSPEWTVG